MRHFFDTMKTELLYQIFRESSGISTDTRTLIPGQIFFALWGDNYNGNKFASEAIEKGAKIAVIDDASFENGKTILVDDCLFELQALATHYRKETKALVLAITGTNGKTTTKELLTAILSCKFKVHSTKGNLNNQIGVPLTILSAPEGTEMMIIEMGASHVGEIRTLCNIARPDYGIITNTGIAHIEGFGSLEGVIRSKTELYEYLRKTNGVALYNDKDPVLKEKIFKMVNRAVPFSDPTGISLHISPDHSDINLSLSANYMNQTFRIHTNLFGSYNLENLKAAIAAGLFLGVDMEIIADAIEKYIPGNNRSEVKVTKNNTLICDSYNANPTSMNIAIESFAKLETENKICILGDMLELGDKSGEEHSRVIENLKSSGFKNVYLAGLQFTKASEGSGFKSFPDAEKLKDFLMKEALTGNHILIKGSRGMALEKLYAIL